MSIHLKKEKLQQIARRHAEQAFAWLREHGEETQQLLPGMPDGRLMYSERGKKPSQWAVFDDKKNLYAHNQAAKLTYLFALKEAGVISEDPPFAKSRKLNSVKSISGTMEGSSARQIWEWLKYDQVKVIPVGPLAPQEDTVFLVISERYKQKPNMSPKELLEAAQGNWDIALDKRNSLVYAVAAVKRVVKAVYRIADWQPADEGKWKFSGKLAEKSVLHKCLNRKIRHPYGGSRYYGNLEEFMARGGDFTDNAQRENEDNMESREIKLLRQFYQIILYGPPGTGKTYTAKEILAELLGAEKNALPELQKNGRWNIVQFHPSYNYEDFVRGIKVDAENGTVVYKTENRTFGYMCKRAGEALKSADGDVKRADKYALIIDEINRANVSAVLGELIYALEYRGKPIRTPYSADGGQNITIPENLYIIGTMNTADRTIGQIDYAVRRRFAFVECLPDEKLVKEKSPEALHVYQEVQKLFRRPDDGGYLSSDFDADDVRIGHSYFLADEEKNIPSNQQIGYKIIWQVAPILHEYVKDGILLMQKNADGKFDVIERIKKLAEELAKKPQAGESVVADSSASDGKFRKITADELRKIKSENLHQACDYIRARKLRDANRTLYFWKRGKRKQFFHVIDRDGEKFKYKDVVRMAYFFALRDLGEINESPPFDNVDANTENLQGAQVDNFWDKGEFKGFTRQDIRELDKNK